MATQSNPRIGVAAVIRSGDGRFVLGRRKGSHGVGKWQFPGGHLDYGEDAFACARRETFEETGLAVRALGILAVTNDVFAQEHKHYMTVFVVCEREDARQQPETREPDKCDGWHWKTWAHVADLAKKGPDAADGLFLPIIHMLEQVDKPLWVSVEMLGQ